MSNIYLAVYHCLYHISSIPIYLSKYIFIYLPIYLFVPLPVNPFIYLSIHLSIQLPIHPSVGIKGKGKLNIGWCIGIHLQYIHILPNRYIRKKIWWTDRINAKIDRRKVGKIDVGIDRWIAGRVEYKDR